MKTKRLIAALLTAAVTASMAVMPIAHADDSLTGMVIYVATNGNDSNDGTEASPLATMKGARDKIRQIKKTTGLPADGITVAFREGTYQWTETLDFTEEDSGTANGKIVYRSYPGEKAVMEAGIRIPGSDFQKVTNEEILQNWSSAKVKENIRQIDIKSYMAKHGYTDISDYYPLVYDRYGFTGDYQAQSDEVKNEYGARTRMRRPIYSFDGEQALWLARYPNKEGGWYEKENPQTKFLTVGQIVKDGRTEDVSSFKYNERRISKYAGKDDVYMYGCLWAIFYHDDVKVKINADDQTIETALPMYYGGIKSDKSYFLYNILEELDMPGEYYVDKNTGMMYVYPNGDISEKTLNVALLDEEWMIDMEYASNITFSGLTFENSQGGGIMVYGGDSVRVEYCTVQNMGTVGISLGQRRNMPYIDLGDALAWKDYDSTEGDTWWAKQTNYWLRDDRYVPGTNHGVYGSKVWNIGQDGIYVDGGNLHRDELANHYIENCDIEYAGMLKRTYAPAIKTNVVYGITIKDNIVAHCPSAGISGNVTVMTMQGNHIYDCMCESADNGCVYINYQYPNLDIKFIDNYFENTPSEEDQKNATATVSQRSGIAFDNSYGGGVEYTNNVFFRIPKGLFMHDNIIFNNNLLVDCFMPIQADTGVTSTTPVVPETLTLETISPLFAYTRYMLGWPIWDTGDVGARFTKLWTEKYPTVMEWVENVKSGAANGKPYYEAKNNLFVNKSVPLSASANKIGQGELYRGASRNETENNVYTDDISMFVDYANDNIQLTAEGSAKYGNTLNLATTGPKIDMVGADKYAAAKVALPAASGSVPATTPAVTAEVPEKVKDAVILRIGSPNAWAKGAAAKIDSTNDAVQARIIDSRTLVPARFITESFGGEVGWDNATRTVTITVDGKTVQLQIDNKDLMINGEKALEMDVPAQIVEERTMVPLRVLCETVLAKKVFWDPMGLIVISDTDILDASADADVIKTTFDLLK